MSLWLKQSTAVTVKLGPFIDDVDFKTAETALTISQADIRLSKNGGAFAQSNNAAGATHDASGYYGVPLDTTDTNTLGTLRVFVAESGALQVWQDFMVAPANVWDSLFGADFLQVDATQLLGTTFATPTVAGVPEVDVTHWIGTAAATPTVAGVPEVDLTHIAGAAVSTTTAQLGVNAVQVSGDGGAADNLEAAFDGTGSVFTLTQLRINSAAAGGAVDIDNSAGPAISAATSSGNAVDIASTGGNGDGIHVAGNGSGDGLDAVAGATGVGMRLTGGATSGDGLRATATTGDGITAQAATVGSGITAYGAAGPGLLAQGDTDNPGAQLTGDGTGAGLLATGGTTAPGATLMGGAVSGAGLLAQGNGAGAGVQAVGTSGNQGLIATGNGSAAGFRVTGGASGAGLEAVGQGGAKDIDANELDNIQADTNDLQTRLPAALVGGRIDASVGAMAAAVVTAAAIATDAIDADALAADAVTEIQAGLSTLTAANVNAEVVDALNVDTYAEIGQEAPAATQTIRKMLAFLFKAWRNKSTQDATDYKLFNDAGTVVDQKATVSDSGTVFTRDEIGTGP